MEIHSPDGSSPQVMESDHWTLRELRIMDMRSGTSRTLYQYQMSDWPDHGVPRSPAPFARYLAAVKLRWQAQQQPQQPILVHCSAGVGRTGVFILADIAVASLLDTGYVDLPQTLIKLREQRPHMVQTMAQYAFVYDALAYM